MPKTVICKHCNKEGHYQTFCPSKPRKAIEKSQSLGKDRKSVKSAKIKPVSDKQKQRLVKYHKLRLEYLNAHSKCEANLENCTKFSTEIHHKASRDGDNLFKHFCAVCRNCHTFIHDKLSLEEGIELGLLIRKTAL